jgi:hypothetical protein
VQATLTHHEEAGTLAAPEYHQATTEALRAQFCLIHSFMWVQERTRSQPMSRGGLVRIKRWGWSPELESVRDTT